MNTSNQSHKEPSLKRVSKQQWAKTGGFLIGLVGIVAAVVTIAQLRHDISDARSQNSALAARLALLEKRCELQCEAATLQAFGATSAPAATAVARRQVQLESTIQILEQKRLAIGAPESREARVDRLFAEWDRPDSPGCALAVIRDGEIVYKRGYGMANLEHDIPISPRTTFYVGSVSKQFTAMSVLFLAEEGKLSLDDDVRQYIPEIPDYGHPITIRHLIHHTSGLPDYFLLWYASGRDFADYMPEEDVLDLLAQQRTLEFTPGDRFEYSNSGYYLLSLIVKRVSGESLREFAEKNIFQPLGMRDTHFHDDRTVVVKNRADGHVPREDGGFGIFVTSFDLVGSGGLYTTVEDLFLWDQNFYQNELGKGGQGLIDRMLTRGTLDDGEELDYAFGLVVEEYRGSKMISHGGGFIGFRAEVIRFPGQYLSVAVLCNLNSIDAGQLARSVADIYLFSEGVD